MSGTVREFFHAATVGGATALGREDLGRLAPGCTADISIFDISRLETGPIDDPMRTLVHFSHRSNCDRVIIGGREVVANGLVVGLDEEALYQRTQEVWSRYKAGIVSWDYANRSADSILPPTLSIDSFPQSAQ